VRRRVDRFALLFEWMGIPSGGGGLAGTVIGIWMWGGLGSWFCVTVSVFMAVWFAIGFWRPVHRRFGFPRNARWIAPP